MSQCPPPCRTVDKCTHNLTRPCTDDLPHDTFISCTRVLHDSLHRNPMLFLAHLRFTMRHIHIFEAGRKQTCVPFLTSQKVINLQRHSFLSAYLDKNILASRERERETRPHYYADFICTCSPFSFFSYIVSFIYLPVK